MYCSAVWLEDIQSILGDTACDSNPLYNARETSNGNEYAFYYYYNSKKKNWKVRHDEQHRE